MAMADTAIDFGLLTGAGAPVRAYNAGDVIFRQGDKAEELFVVQSGTVEIRLGNRLLDTLPERSIFGEMALIDGAPPAPPRSRRPTSSSFPSARNSFCSWSAARPTLRST